MGITKMSRIQLKQEKDFRFILRIFNSNIDGKQKIPFAIRRIRGIGRRLSTVITQRAGDLTDENMEKIIDIVSKPLEYEIPSWFLNRRKDPKDGTNSQQTTNNWDTKLREDLEKMKKMKLHKG